MEKIFIPQTVQVKLKDIKPCARNTKKHPQVQIDNIAQSIKQFGFVQPIVLDGSKDNEIIIGHGRYFAAKQLKMQEVPCVYVADLTDEQIRKLRILDNKLNESEWDVDILKLELDDLDFGEFDVEFDFSDDFDVTATDGSSADDKKYTQKINIPQYEPQGEKPDIKELVDLTKTNELIAEIRASKELSDEQKNFLIEAAKRHSVFDYRKIAEYYAQSDKTMQYFMEKSALVIIDYEDAIKNGYTTLYNELFNGEENDDEE